jgi:pimeloyl-ACP methyl ester carboxylesterase
MPPSRSPEPTPPVPLNGVHRLHDERWSTAAGRPVRMLTAGGVVADRPQVVLVPGLGSVGYLLELLHACGGWTRATLVDLPGFGHRRTAALPADLDTLTDTLTAVLQQLSGSPVVVAGHSTGSQLALRAALRVPERLHGLVLIGPTFEPRARRPTHLLARHLRTSAFEPPGQLRYTLPDYLRGGRRFAQYVRSALADRPEDHIASVAVPVLVARGRHDHYSSTRWVQALADAAPRGQARTLPGAHAVPYNHPGAAAQVIGEACSEPSAG